MEKFEILETNDDKFMFIIYPFPNDKNVTYGFKISKSELYQLKLKLDEIIPEKIK